MRGMLFIGTFCFILPLALSAQVTEKSPAGFFSERPSGLYNVTSFSVAPLTSPVMNGFRTVFGYRLNPHLGFGGGIGLERYVSMPLYDELQANLSMMPLFADIRYSVLNSAVSPVFTLNGGYTVLLNIPSTNQLYYYEEIFPGMAWNEYYDYDTYDRGGWFISGEAGVRVRAYKRLGAYLAVSYSVWQVAGERHSWLFQYLPGSSGTNEKIYHSTQYTTAYVSALLFRIGFVF